MILLVYVWADEGAMTHSLKGTAFRPYI